MLEAKAFLLSPAELGVVISLKHTRQRAVLTHGPFFASVCTRLCQYVIWGFGNGLKKRRKTKTQVAQNPESIEPQGFPGCIFFGNKRQNRRTSERMSFCFGFRRPKGGSTLQRSNCSAEAPARGCRLADAAAPLRGPAGFAAGAPPAGRRFRQNGRTMSARPFLCLHKRERSICRHPAVRPSASRRAAGPWPGSRRPRRRRRRPPGPGRWAGTCCSAWGWSAPA